MMTVHFPLHLSKQLVFKMFKERVHNVYFEYFVLLILVPRLLIIYQIFKRTGYHSCVDKVKEN